MYLVDHSFPFLYGSKLLVTARPQSWNDIQLAPTLWWYFKGKWTLCCRHNHNSESLFWTKCAFPLIMSADWSCYQSPMRSYWAGIKKISSPGSFSRQSSYDGWRWSSISHILSSFTKVVLIIMAIMILKRMKCLSRYFQFFTIIAFLCFSDEGDYKCEITYLDINRSCPVVQV